MSTRFDLPRRLVRLFANLLYLRARTQVIVGRGDRFDLNPALPVCYVLEHRYLTDLAVLDRECRVRNLPDAMARLSIRPLRGRRVSIAMQGGRGQPIHTEELEVLVSHALADPSFDIQLIPVSILWGRAPGTQESIVEALFAETWQVTTGLRHMLNVLIHGRQTVVRIDLPGSLRELMRGDTDVGHATQRLARIFRLHFYRERTRAIGPDLSHRNTQLRALLGAREVREAIAAEALEKNIPFVKAEAVARDYALEIASDLSYTLTRAFMLIMDWATRRVFDGVTVAHLDRLESLPRNATLVYVPTHRSYLDAPLLNHFLYRNGNTFPHAVAGANLNVPVVGRLLRGIGAFYLRRKIKGNALYTTVFNQYMYQMIDRGFPLQYYIEGTRSRSGALLTPRTGMLGMTVHGYLRSRSRPLYFVPVYFGYEKLIEGGTYLEEFGGKAKKGESLLGMIRGTRKLRQQYGKVFANIGEPLRLSSFLDAQAVPWRESAGTGLVDAKAPWLRASVGATGAELARRINAAAVVHPVSFVALCLLATPKCTADLRVIERQIEHLQYLAGHCGLPDTVVCSGDAPAAMIERGIALGLLSRYQHSLGDLLRANDAQAGLLAYARNNVIHLFALPSLLAGLVSHNLLLSRSKAREAIHGIYGLLQAQLFLPWPADQLSGAIDATERALITRGLIIYDEVADLLRAPLPQAEAHGDLTALVEILRSTVERQFLILALLQQVGSGVTKRDDFEQAGHLLAQRLSALYVMSTPDFAEKALFVASVGNLLDLGLLSLDAEGRLCFDERITVPAAQTQLLLAPLVRHSIERLARVN
jgi:glycerol-3-phosphate O-acyltransferase